MDGTLIDSLGFWEELWGRIGDKYFGGQPFEPNDEDSKALRTMMLSDVADMLHDHYRIADSGGKLLEFIEDQIIAFYKAVKPKDGVIPFLDHLSRLGVKMCIASATAPHLLSVALDACDLRKYFAFVISCTDVGSGKDKPDIFLEAVKRLGTPFEETWLFEDSLVALKTAEEIGMNRVGIYDKNTSRQDEIRRASTVYIDCGETLMKLV